MRGVPEPVEPAEYTVDGTWSIGEDVRHSITADGEELDFKIEERDGKPLVIARDVPRSPKVLWTIVCYCRDYGVPGVWKEMLKFRNASYRLGGLYMYYGFEPTERESNYEKCGENPYAVADS